MKYKKSIEQAAKYVIIPLLLFFFGIWMSLYAVVTYRTGFTILPIIHNPSFVMQPLKGKLIKGNVLNGSFIASDNNLGSIALRMQNLNSDEIMNTDKITFRIKQKGANTWYYTHEYLGTQFYELSIFPFGFPLIADSKGKIYMFQIFSESGTQTTAVTISDIYPNFVSEYKINKSDLEKKPRVFVDLLSKKLQYALTQPSIIFTFYIYILPFLVYIFFLQLIKKVTFLKISVFYIKLLKKIHILVKTTSTRGMPLAIILLYITIIVDILFIDYISNINILIISILLIISYRKYHIPASYSFSVALFLLVLCPLLLILDLNFIAQKAALWAYVFLVFGTVQAGYQLVKSKH